MGESDRIGRGWARLRAMMGGLAGQLLALSIAVVIMADILLLGPALGGFHDAWLARHAAAGQTAALAAEGPVTPEIQRELLNNAGVVVVTLHRDDARVLTLSAGLPPDAPIRTVDLRQPRVLASIADGVQTLFAPRDRLVRVLATPGFGGGRLVDIIVREGELRTETIAFAQRAFVETLVVSAFVGAILYGALLALVVRRIRRLTTAIAAFGKRPQDASVDMPPAQGDDEITRAEHALGRMGEEVRAAFRQRERLAGLGAAVAKIAHDLRNSLATAQLVTDRIAHSDDPAVRQSAPRLERALTRASALAEAALRYGKADEPKPVLRTIDVRVALDDAAGDALARMPDVVWRNDAPAGLAARADADDLHRILVNLIRNAGQALKEHQAPVIEATAVAGAGLVSIDVADNGPGIPEAVRGRLFQPFATAQRDGGVGLGLAIARELARAQGGDLVLANSASGACFRLTLAAA